MIKQRTLTLAIAGLFALSAADSALARKHHHAAAQKPAEAVAPAVETKASQPIGKLVEYTELEQRVGSDLVIETTFDTVRRGKLIKYTNPGLTIQLGPEHGSVELTVPRETIRNVSVVLPPAQEAAPAAATAPPPATTPAPAKTQPGASSAKKN
ncbi:hypothetical protein [Dokdonella sp.]|uniref:hypothetical protein n=1 Tax=Dokdonella sp. TaxID=2291710 RepID=UPI003783B9B8